MPMMWVGSVGGRVRDDDPTADETTGDGEGFGASGRGRPRGVAPPSAHLNPKSPQPAVRSNSS